MSFKELLSGAKVGNDPAFVRIADMYRPLLKKESIVYGEYDEDLYQELLLTLLNCIRKFEI